MTYVAVVILQNRICSDSRLQSSHSIALLLPKSPLGFNTTLILSRLVDHTSFHQGCDGEEQHQQNGKYRSKH